MTDSDEEAGGFKLTGESVEITDLSTGRRVDRPDIAARGIGYMTEAIEAAGGEIDSSNVRLIKPGTITGYTPRDPSFELGIDYGVHLAEMIRGASFGDVDPAIVRAPVPTELGVVQVTTRLINLDRTLDGQMATNLLDVSGFRPATLAELIAFATHYPWALYQATIPALGTQVPAIAGESPLVPVLVVEKSATRLVLERFHDDWDRACRFLAVAN
jgi:hypothetical protein